MANQNGAFGFNPVRMQGSGPSTNGQTRYAIANGKIQETFSKEHL